MAPKQDEKPVKAASEAEEKKEVQAAEKSTSSADASLNTVLTRLSQQFNLLAILVVALFMFQAYTFYKLKNVETNGTVAGAGAPVDSPLSKEKLVVAAKEIGLDEKKFEQCLDGGSKKAIVEAESKEAAGLNVQGTPGFFINGRFLGGAFPFENFKEIIDAEIKGTASNECSGWSEEMQKYCADPNNLAFNPAPQKVSAGNSPTKGPKDAKVTIIEYSDFECPFCQRAFATVEEVLKAYPKDVKLVYKQLPLTSIHPNAQRAAEASLCALDQGKFWEMHDKMFQSQMQ